MCDSDYMTHWEYDDSNILGIELDIYCTMSDSPNHMNLLGEKWVLYVWTITKWKLKI